MYKILEKTEDSVLVKMDIKTFETLENDMNEDFNEYEFVFEKPVKASVLVNS